MINLHCSARTVKEDNILVLTHKRDVILAVYQQEGDKEYQLTLSRDEAKQLAKTLSEAADPGLIQYCREVSEDISHWPSWKFQGMDAMLNRGE